jgi:glycosyltransferase involved in cell wall biosynthesis
MSKVLLVAFAACPGMGSEAGIGWNFALGLSARHEVTLLTTPDFRKQITEHLAAHPEVKLRVKYHGTFLPRGLMYKSYPTANIYYYCWQLRIIALIQKLHRNEHFDVVHHVNWGRYWMLSGAAFVDAPFVWGPVGAAESPTWKLLDGMGLRGRTTELARNFLRRLFELDPLTRITAGRAACAIAATRETLDKFKHWRLANTKLMCSVGIDENDLPRQEAINAQPASEPGGYEFVSIGRLLDWKGFHLGLRAFAKANIQGAKYAILGQGPEMDRLKQLARQLRIEDRVDFLGQRPRSECLEILSGSRTLIHPSMHDSGGFVLVEAMALGKPVICLHIGGPAVIVDENSGISLRSNSAHEAISQLTDAMCRLHTDNALYRKLSAGAKQRAHHEFLWSGRMAEIDRIYAEVIHGAAATGKSSARESPAPTNGKADFAAPTNLESRKKSDRVAV